MKVMNKSGGQLSLKGLGNFPVIVLAKDAEHSFTDEKELAAYKPSIKVWGAMLELSADKAAPAKAEKPAEPKKEEIKQPEAPKKEEPKKEEKPAKEDKKKDEIK